MIVRVEISVHAGDCKKLGGNRISAAMLLSLSKVDKREGSIMPQDRLQC